MKQFETIEQYYLANGHTPPRQHDFDIRRFEQYYREVALPRDVYEMAPFRVTFYGIGLLTAGTADKHLGIPFDANLVIYAPYQLISFNGVQGNWKGYYVFFDRDFLSSLGLGRVNTAALPFWRPDGNYQTKLSKQEVARLLPIFKTIYEEFNSSRKDRFSLIEIYLTLLINLLKRITDKRDMDNTGSRNKPEVKLVERYQRIIEQQLSRGIVEPAWLSPVFYADKLSIHPNYLNSIAKKVTERTAKQLIQDNRMVQAKALLLQTTLSVKEIAYRLGFKDAAQFTHFFKKNSKFSPSVFRAIDR